MDKQFVLGANPTAAQTAALAALAQVQRLFELTPDASEVIALHQSGFSSSWGIARVTPGELALNAGVSVDRVRPMRTPLESLTHLEWVDVFDVVRVLPVSDT